MKDRLHRGFKVSKFAFAGDNLEDSVQYEKIENHSRLFALLRTRACRRLKKQLAQRLL